MGTRRWKDHLFFLYRLLFLQDGKNTFGLTNLQDERMGMILKHAKGNLLDVGCGYMNKACRRYSGLGVGIDVFPWSGIDILCDTRYIPFKHNSFDTVSFIASFNHIPRSWMEPVLLEVRRVLKEDGLLLITMVNPIISWINHKIHCHHDMDQKVRGMTAGEVWGYWHREMVNLLNHAGFNYVKRLPFLYYLSYLYIGIKNEKSNPNPAREI